MPSSISVLNQNQKKVLSKLSFLTRDGFYLAGGTSLAIQIGHRTSFDFDFYTPNHFDQNTLFDKFLEIFGDEAIKTSLAKNTLFCTLKTVDCSFFTYPYKLLKKPVLKRGMAVVSLEDIAAMKLLAVNRRPAKRDYVDVYYLLEKFSLGEMIDFAKEKFPNFNFYYLLRALSYFEDIKDDERRKIQMTDKNFSWEAAKNKLSEEANKYQLSMFKK
ncbi:hypothetical protein COY29_05170 [Candidatus Woesebacteria bacterium CG_4_10_14_0_2_um_filter_39_14]|uniref:Nucleotidyl transferase AbiEii/AbiGii toxin family protein n=2 Tax=Candidatus Woeseibacteriota TaxID=1752722 RepID=A0A2M7TKW8_9BACT|nr:MAG: hypothetical protein COY29_05170 [Candidatus Woesebacteria bacterium CG_4_10_14_0_2_um_filter_39_14]